MADDRPSIPPATRSPADDERPSGPEDRGAAAAMARRPRSLRPVRLVAGICVLGLLLTGLATWAVARADNNTEQRLLQTQTRQAAAVLSTAIVTIQQSLTAALDAQKAVGPARGGTAFTRIFAQNVGPDQQFVSASLWHRDGDVFTRVSTIGPSPGPDPHGSQTQAFLAHALSIHTFAVRRMSGGGQERIAYASGDQDTGFVVYAERAIPADRRSPVDRNSAFADLDYAIYLGPGTDSAAMTTTDVDPSSLPLKGLTAQVPVPFGDTTLTLVTSPRTHLGSTLSQRLPWILLLSGLLLTLALALVTRQLVRTRQRAEHDTETITTLYQRVDTLYGEQRALSVRLQRALLPQVNPGITGIEISTEYVAGAKGIDIGGDWYSAIAVDDDTFAFVVGDVSGNGVDAVAEMARARFTLRAYLFDGDDAATALAKCSRQFDVTTDGHIITVLVGVGNRRTGEVTAANAGHPLPVLVSDAGASLVPMPVGLPLGAGPWTYDSATFTLPVGATLIVYTDGLVERRAEDLDTGMRRLVETVQPLVAQPLQAFVSEVVASMRDPDTADDVAVLALRRGDPVKTRLASDSRAPSAARSYVARQLATATVPEGVVIDDVVLIASELVTNSVRGGAGWIDLTLRATDGRLDLLVEDDADGWPVLATADDDATGGRGLSIVDRLADTWVVTPQGRGKRVTATWLDRA
jgi:serine phosphatase RsbU (regulator of sigma subunit)/anti-sigma regulatory factor (Ser/Thr protein kinase)